MIIFFEKVFNNSDNNFRSKAAYWLALTNIEKNSDKKKISKWLKEASKNKFSFYGQNAALKLETYNLKKEKNVLRKPEKYEDLIEDFDTNILKVLNFLMITTKNI